MKKIKILISLVLIVVLIFSIFLYVKQKKAAKVLAKDIKEKQEEVNNLENIKKGVDRIQKEFEESKRREKDLFKKISDSDDAVLDVMKEVIRHADISGFTNIKLTFQGIESADIDSNGKTKKKKKMPSRIPQGIPAGLAGKFPGMANNASKKVTVSGVSVTSKPFTVEATAEYNEFYSFLGAVYSMDKIVAVKGFNIERDESLLPYQKVSVELETYIFGD